MKKFSPTARGFFDDNIHTGEQIPADALEISDAEYEALFAGQSLGKLIVPGLGGRPVVVDPPPLSSNAVEVRIRAVRDILLALCDWTQVRDVPAETAAKWEPYRQALRDLPSQAGFPAVVDWPEMQGLRITDDTYTAAFMALPFNLRPGLPEPGAAI